MSGSRAASAEALSPAAAKIRWGMRVAAAGGVAFFGSSFVEGAYESDMWALSGVLAVWIISEILFAHASRRIS
ncbi:MAG: hypothetical protein AAB955_03430 [Patescibacteria group bacterium]